MWCRYKEAFGRVSTRSSRYYYVWILHIAVSRQRRSISIPVCICACLPDYIELDLVVSWLVPAILEACSYFQHLWNNTEVIECPLDERVIMLHRKCTTTLRYQHCDNLKVPIRNWPRYWGLYFVDLSSTWCQRFGCSPCLINGPYSSDL